MLVTLIVLATGAFVLGVALEQGAEDSHQETSEATNAESGESETGNAEAGGEGEAAHSGEGEARSAGAFEESSDGESDATLLGINLESTPLVIVVALGSLALAAAVWVRPGLGLLLVLVAVAMVVFAAFDVREMVHQLDEDRDGLALLVAVVAALHLAAAGVAAVSLRGAVGASRSQPVVISRLIALCAVAVALAGVVGCGSEADGSRAALGGQVYDFKAGSQVSLASRTVEGRPTLLWFWAPWCDVCNAEASTVKKLATTAKERLRVIGVGGRDSVEAGRDFVERHGLGATSVVYDEPGRVWDGFGIGPQPAAVLLDRDGQELRRWQGPFDPREAEDLASQ